MYITVQEFKNAPTAIDCSNIIPGGTQAQNDAELTNVIRRASTWVNQICKMPTLEASTNTEMKEVYLNNSGIVRVHPDMVPILTLLDSVQYKMSPINDWIPLDLSDITVFPRYFTVYNLVDIMVNPQGVQPFAITPYRDPYTQWNIKNTPITIQYSYINGYPNTLLVGNVASDSTTITVKNATGMLNQTLTIYDGDHTEDVVIKSVARNEVTLASPILFDHTAGIPVSSLPDSVKQATVLLAAYLIQERGQLSITMANQNMSGLKQSSGSNVELAKELLRPFIRGVIS